LHGPDCAATQLIGETEPAHLGNLLVLAHLTQPGACAAATRTHSADLTPEETVAKIGADLEATLEAIINHPLPDEPIHPTPREHTTFDLPVNCPQHGWETVSFQVRRAQAEDTMAAVLSHVAAQHADSCEHFQIITQYAHRPPVPHGMTYGYARWLQAWAAVLLDTCRGGAQAVANGLHHASNAP
jgi:hypothetical protein